MSAREVTRLCCMVMALAVTALIVLGALFVTAVVAWATVSVYPQFAIMSFIATAIAGVAAAKLYGRHSRRAELAAIVQRFDRAPMLWWPD